MNSYDDGESFTVDDDEVDWSQVNELRMQMATINSIEDDDDRLAAAIEWQQMLEAG